MRVENIIIQSIPKEERVELEGTLTVKQGFGLNMWHSFKFVMTDKAIWFRENKTNLIQFGIKDMCILYSDIESYKESNFMLRKGLILNYKNNKGRSGKIFFDKFREEVEQILNRYIEKQEN